jgi:hypothetical protein
LRLVFAGVEPIVEECDTPHGLISAPQVMAMTATADRRRILPTAAILDGQVRGRCAPANRHAGRSRAVPSAIASRNPSGPSLSARSRARVCARWRCAPR